MGEERGKTWIEADYGKPWLKKIHRHEAPRLCLRRAGQEGVRLRQAAGQQAAEAVSCHVRAVEHAAPPRSISSSHFSSAAADHARSIALTLDGASHASVGLGCVPVLLWLA